MLNIEKKQCTGCEACVNACPNNCISMEMDEEGFYYPTVHKEQCILCGKCESVCGGLIEKKGNRVAYVGYSKNKKTRESSSSGGVFSEIANKVLKSNGVVYGAAYDEELDVRHIRIDDIDEIWRLRGSKYVQSIIGDTYVKIFEDIKQGRSVLFVGTPCQVNGLYRFLGTDYAKLITCAVVCHGVPSPGVFKRYLKYQQGRIGSKLTLLDFRNKEHEGWHNFFVKYAYEDYVEYVDLSDDLYMKGFLENLFLRESCYECVGKQKTDYADIILGDYWGVDDAEPNIDAYYGVNAIIVNTEKGEKIINGLNDNCDFKRTEYDYVLKYNPALEFSPKRTDKRDSFFQYLKVTHDIKESIEKNIAWQPANGNKEIQLYPIVEKYTEDLLCGKSLCKKLRVRGKKRVVLYANTELLRLFRLDLKNEKMDVVLSDMDSTRMEKMYPGELVMSRETVLNEYRSGKIDCIVVCSITFENEIVDGFVSDGVSLKDIYNATELVCGLN